MRRFHFLFLLLLFSLHGTALSKKDDFEIWLYTAFPKKIHEKATFFFETEYRFRDNASTLYLYYFQARMQLALCNWLEVAPGYRQQFIRPAERWKMVYNPLVDIFFHRGQFSLRNRIQYFIVERGPDLWQYRARLMWEGSCHLGCIEVRPTIFEEIFWRERLGFFQNRVAFGAKVPIGKRLDITALYILRHLEREQDWKRHHVLFLGLTLSL